MLFYLTKVWLCSFMWSRPALWPPCPSPSWVPCWRTWLMWRGSWRTWTYCLDWPACCPKEHAPGKTQYPRATERGLWTPPHAASTQQMFPEKTEKRGRRAKGRRREKRILTPSSQLLFSCGQDCSPFCVGTTGRWNLNMSQWKLRLRAGPDNIILY